MLDFLRGLLEVLKGVAEAFRTYGAHFGLALALAAWIQERRNHTAEIKALRSEIAKSEEGRRADIVAELRAAAQRAEALAPLSQNLLAAIGYFNGLVAERARFDDGEPRRRRSLPPKRARGGGQGGAGAGDGGDPEPGEG